MRLLKLIGVINITCFETNGITNNIYNIVFPSPGVLSICIHCIYVLFTIKTYREHIGCDPKDGELCLIRLKSGETLMEDRSNSDVQIDCQSWV